MSRRPHLFAPAFAQGDWSAWRVLIAALFAEAAPEEAGMVIYRDLTGRTTWPTTAFIEAVLIVGRRGGKSRILALIAVYLATMRNYAPYLAPGEVATIAIIAADQDQARAIFNFVDGLLKAVPLLHKMVVSANRLRITLLNRVRIEIGTASFRSTRGYTFAAVLADELAFWRSEESSANPDVEIMRAIRPGLATIPGAMLLMASSPYAKKGELYNAFRKYYGKDDAKVLVWKAPTLSMHPGLDKTIVDEAYESDPEAARAEYGAEFRDDLADYITREAVDAVTMRGRSEVPPQPGIAYRAFCDPSGGSRDAMTLAIVHLDRNGMLVLDALLEIRAPFHPDEAIAACVALLNRYGVAKVVGDKYASEWPRARFAESGIEFEQSARPKSDLYSDLLPLINAGRIELLDLPRLSVQLCGLERRTSRSGKDSIDHSPGGHDDLANAVAGALVGLDLDRRQPLVTLDDVLTVNAQGERVALPLPRHVGGVFAVVASTKDGANIATVFCGHEKYDDKLYILDVVAGPLWRNFLPDTVTQLMQLKRAVTAWSVHVQAPENLARLFNDAGMPAQAPPDWFNVEDWYVYTSQVLNQKRIKFCEPTVDKMKTQTIAAALELKAGDPVGTALQTALITAICLKADWNLPHRPRARARA